ncbi:mannonate dehydratase [Roseomonas sp. SSH11]|uniref:Mannonate dehydratase n=1 Tax=Pararoseomonas baculiformis TaxID=2820812 RepID=A0ABS4AAQ4_9PROT|nr:mannonate dehydratase [Pararoseomonas baculiformis]MBP0444079.1 mannonate dehydratase [Pararoseomonas baculiformis]
MLESWRWFGPDDPVTLGHVRQTGAAGVVSALHHLNQGRAWPEEEVLRRKAEIEAAGLRWAVVESIAVAEDIKTRTGDFRTLIEAYKDSIRAVARAGVRTICYNFMAVTDWTRTDLAWRVPSGGYALRFDWPALAAYDLFVLRRPGAEADHPPERRAAAEARFRAMSESDVAALERVLIDWLPAREFVYDRAGFQRMLDIYRDVGTDGMRANLFEFLREITPVAAEEGARLCIHPDDPAFPIFGLPRVMSTAADARALLQAIPDRANGLTLCTGAFGSNPANDLPAMAEEFGPRIHFAHLRNVTIEPDGSFHEADHLDGHTDMVAVVSALLREEERRRAEGRVDAEIPMRPDHGHLLVDDIGKRVNPGYSCIGRLKGLAELRGVIRAVEAFRAGRVH